MISDLTLARAAFAQATTPADALLGVARAQLKLADAPRQAANDALKTGAAPDIAAAEQAVLTALEAGTVDKSA